MRKEMKDRHSWKMGFTTGSCAAGAAKAACFLLKGLNQGTQVDIPLPQGERLQLSIHRWEMEKDIARVGIIKDAGDDPDVTHGLEVVAQVRVLSEKGEILIRGGQGIGVVTKKGLQIPPGESAINPVPRSMIQAAVREVFPQEEVLVVIEVPDGEELASKTLNPRLGIRGGLSILGTTGIVRPMSEEAFKNSILPELDQAVAYGHKAIVLTPGNYGFRAATAELKVPEEAIIQMANFVGFLLEEAAYRKIEKVLLFGHIGKLIKVAGGIFHTHTHVADARMEILVAHAALNGIDRNFLQTIAEYPTVEGAAEEIRTKGWGNLLFKLAERASCRAQEHVHGEVQVGTAFTLLNGEIIAWDDQAKEICKEFWHWPQIEKEFR
ncbi:cobalt-precorrin-5B (C(1))-methyltransferase CbiD [Desulfitobacterium dehalogenans]|nr:cobalt-precorrin-5B (C(1))-methyltransferase CbiD [Desulfitobacterium dehalogenans]